MRDTVVRAERDWAHRRVGLLAWGPPSVVILASALGASLLYGAGILPLGARAWLWIGAVLFIGTALADDRPRADQGTLLAQTQERRCWVSFSA